MVYMGSKNRIAKYLLPFLTKYLTLDRWYVEPFCGGCNMMDKVNHPLRLASDSNNYLIAMWRWMVEKNYDFPKKITKEDYAQYRELFNTLNKSETRGNGDTSIEAFIGWIGLMASVNGKFYQGSYCNTKPEKRDYVKEHINNVLAQKDKLKGVVFKCGSYDKIDIPENSVIYCDIPYQGTEQYYKSAKGFDSMLFWQWSRDKTAQGNDVLISEYQAPNDFIPIWQMELTNSMHQTNTYKPIEKLFVHESIADKYIEKTLFD